MSNHETHETLERGDAERSRLLADASSASSFLFSCRSCVSWFSNLRVWQRFFPFVVQMKHRWKSSVLIRVSSVATVACLLRAASLCAEDKLPKRIEELLAPPHFKTAHIGLLFVDLETGEVV